MLSDILFDNHSSKIKINISKEKFRIPALKKELINKKKLDQETKDKIFKKIKKLI